MVSSYSAGNINFSLTEEQGSTPTPSHTWKNLCHFSLAKTITKLDLSHAYQQLVLEEWSRQYVTIHSQWGLFHYNSLLFGVTSALAIFHQAV